MQVIVTYQEKAKHKEDEALHVEISGYVITETVIPLSELMEWYVECLIDEEGIIRKMLDNVGEWLDFKLSASKDEKCVDILARIAKVEVK